MARVSVSGRSEEDAMANKPMMPSTGDNSANHSRMDGPMNRSRGALAALDLPLPDVCFWLAMLVKRTEGALPHRQDVTKGRKRR